VTTDDKRVEGRKRSPEVCGDPTPAARKVADTREPLSCDILPEATMHDEIGRNAVKRRVRRMSPLPLLIRAIFVVFTATGCTLATGYAQQRALAPPEVRFEPTPMKVVQQMLWLADANSGDVVYDLGCGDARIVITAVRRFGARGVCVDIDPRRIAESRENARKAGVLGRIRFVNEDLFATPIGDATVVMLFLSPELNRRLRPKLMNELKPGTRVVSHWHDMEDWRPELTAYVRSDDRDRPVYLWAIPAR
jgi:SAM-dependent methyltransferase